MQKKSKLMVYVRSDLALEVMRWSIRLSRKVPEFCNGCIGDALHNMERGLDSLLPNPSPKSWQHAAAWRLRQGKPLKLKLEAFERLQAQHLDEYRKAQQELKEFETALQAGKVNTKILFQVYEGEEAERWPQKLRRMARSLQIKPNELANRMIAAGITALERQEPLYEPDFISAYRNKWVLPRIEQYRTEKNLAEQFDIYADLPRNLVNDGRAFSLVVENAMNHSSAMVNGLQEEQPFEKAIPYIFRDERLNRSYIEKLKSLYETYRNLGELGPLREKKLKKDVLDALVEEWRKRHFPSESSMIDELKSRLTKLTDDGLNTLQTEIGVLLAKRAKKLRKKE